MTMTNRSFVLSVITSALLMAFFALSSIIGQPQIAFAIVAAMLLSFASWLKFSSGKKQSVKHAKLSHPFYSAGQK